MNRPQGHPHVPHITRLLLALLLVPALALLVPASAYAATIAVACDPTSLRAAINSANDETANPGADTIVLEAGCTYVLDTEDNSDTNGPNGLPAITTAITIQGNDATITRDTGVWTPWFRHFYVKTGGTLTLEDLTLERGLNSLGGAIANYGGTVTLKNSTVRDNRARWDGGGIYNYDQSTLTLVNSTVSGNTAANDTGFVTNYGGGIANRQQATATLTNSTISGDSADNGGGISTYNGTLNLSSSTVSGNSAGVGGGIHLESGSMTLASTIIASQAGGADCSNPFSEPITSQGYNLDSDGSCLLNQPTDLPNTAPLLGPLQDNGGPSSTHGLLLGSPAIDKGNTALTTDQRGESRPYDDPAIAPAAGGNNSDIGALEARPAAPRAAHDSYAVNEDTTLAVAAPGVLGNDTDANSDPLTAVLVSGPSHAAPDGFAFNADGSFTYTPVADYNGPDSFTYQVSDGMADSDTATVSLEINWGNEAPVAVDDAYETNAGVTLTVEAPGVLLNDTDADGDPLWAMYVSGPSHAAPDGFTFNADGSFTYTPMTGYTGSDSFTYQALDGYDNYVVATVSITVNAVVNSPPTVVVAAGGQCFTETSGQINLTVGDAKTAAGALTLSGRSSNTKLVPNSGITFGGSGGTRSLTVTAANKKTGTAVITVNVSDGSDTTSLQVTVKVGGAKNDRMNGTTGPDMLFAAGGNDTINGDSGNDLLCGGSRDDTLSGGGGNDTLVGDAGNDRLTGGADADVFSGGGGTDTATDFNAGEGDMQDSTIP